MITTHRCVPECIEVRVIRRRGFCETRIPRENKARCCLPKAFPLSISLASPPGLYRSFSLSLSLLLSIKKKREKGTDRMGRDGEK
ncbi:hypothetical protein PUN28_015362 [Cardiocondyla obscurior]|uniref:Uncharacterized protein n=1 Tax=Cardiocondyla obscurior TaxID=286306 RepID=A0AAW2EUC6_9HYME